MLSAIVEFASDGGCHSLCLYQNYIDREASLVTIRRKATRAGLLNDHFTFIIFSDASIFKSFHQVMCRRSRKPNDLLLAG